MSDRSAQPSASRLARDAGLAVLSGATVGALVALILNQPIWWQGYLVAVVIVVLSQLIALPMLLLGAKPAQSMAPGPAQARAAASVMAASGVRLIVALVGIVLAITLGGWPALQAIVCLLVVYLVALAVETTLLARQHFTNSRSSV